MKKPLDLSGTPNLHALLGEAERQGLTIELVRRTGEVRVIAAWGRVTCNARRKDGNRAFVALLREGQRQRGER
jgi:hypothetical protein